MTLEVLPQAPTLIPRGQGQEAGVLIKSVCGRIVGRAQVRGEEASVEALNITRRCREHASSLCFNAIIEKRIVTRSADTLRYFRVHDESNNQSTPVSTNPSFCYKARTRKVPEPRRR